MAVIGIWRDPRGPLAQWGGPVAAGDGTVAAGDELVMLPAEATTLPDRLDLCLADAAGLALHATVLLDRKRTEAPVFFPILAVVGAGASDEDIDEVLAVADDVVRLPAGSAEWNGRLRCLLAARERSRTADALARSRRQLDATMRRLAAGIAREIDGPVQYLGDNLRFLADTFNRLVAALDGLAETAMETERADAALLLGRLAGLLDDEDLRYAMEETPAAIRESREGLDRVAGLVAAVERSAAVGGDGGLPVDVAEAVADALAMTRHAWEGAFTVETRLDAELPPVAIDGGVLRLGLLSLLACATTSCRSDREAPAAGIRPRLVLSARLREDRVELGVGVTGKAGCRLSGHGCPEPALASLLERWQVRLARVTRMGRREGDRREDPEAVVLLSLPCRPGPVLDS